MSKKILAQLQELKQDIEVRLDSSIIYAFSPFASVEELENGNYLITITDKNGTTTAQIPVVSKENIDYIINQYINAAVSSVFTYKGTQATVSDLPSTNNKTGDIWHVTADGGEYVWNGTAWEELGSAVDLSDYLQSVSIAGITLTPSSYTITVAQLKTALGLGEAAYKDVDTSITSGSTSTNIPTSQAVASFVAASATDAAQSATNAAASASAAGTAASDATTAKTQAQSAASAAQTSQTKAEQSATAAREAATDAQTAQREMSDGLSDLKSALNTIENNLDGESSALIPVWHYGYISGSNGSVNDRTYENTNRYSDMFLATAGTAITTEYGYNLNIYSYGSDKVFAEKLATIRDIGTPATYTVANDVWIRLSQELASVDATESFDPNDYIGIVSPYKKYVLIDDLQNAVSKANTDLDFISKLLEKGNVLSGIQWFSGYIDNSGGIHGPYVSNANMYTELFRAKKGTTIQSKATTNGNIYSYAADGSFIEKLGVIKNWNIYTVEADTFIRISWEYGTSTSDVSIADDYFQIISFDGMIEYGNIYRTVKPLDTLAGKKIVWFGTSIPAGSNPNSPSYPVLIAQMLGATVYNESVSGSNIRAGSVAGITETDPMGYQGLNWVGVSRSLSLSSSEKQEIFDSWSTWQPLIQNAPASVPSASEQATMKSYSYDNKVAKYLPGGSVGECDLYVIDHGYNDWGNSTINNNDINTIPADADDRRYYIGAMSFIIKYILQAVPHAKILIVGNLLRDPMTPLTEAQKKVRDILNRPLVPLWEYTGFSNEQIVTTGYWNNDNVWVNSGGEERTIRIRQMYLRDNTHPHEDYSGYALRVMANSILPFVRDIIIHD